MKYIKMKIIVFKMRHFLKITKQRIDEIKYIYVYICTHMDRDMYLNSSQQF